MGLNAGTADSQTIATDSIDGIDPSESIYLYDQISGRYHYLPQSAFTLNVNQANTTFHTGSIEPFHATILHGLNSSLLISR